VITCDPAEEDLACKQERNIGVFRQGVIPLPLPSLRAVLTRRDVDLLHNSVPDVAVRDGVVTQVPCLEGRKGGETGKKGVRSVGCESGMKVEYDRSHLALVPCHEGGVVCSDLEFVAEERGEKEDATQVAVDAGAGEKPSQVAADRVSACVVDTADGDVPDDGVG
jgi:hypothetical protein